MPMAVARAFVVALGRRRGRGELGRRDRDDGRRGGLGGRRLDGQRCERLGDRDRLRGVLLVVPLRFPVAVAVSALGGGCGGGGRPRGRAGGGAGGGGGGGGGGGPGGRAGA